MDYRQRVRTVSLKRTGGVAASTVVFSCFIILVSNVADATRVRVRVTNVSSAQGVVRAALCTEAEWVKRDCSFAGQTAASVGTVDVVIDVPAGVYGVLIHHDANGDSVINRNLVGIPTEGIGFSRDPTIHFGFPAFSASSVAVDGEETTVAASLIFEPTGVVASAK